MNAIARLVLLGCLLFGTTAQAQFLNMLGASPVSQFNKADNQLFMATVQKALAEGIDGVPIVWKNEKSPAAGVVTPQKSFVSAGMKCREMLIANTYKTLRGEGVHTFCLNAAGQWKLQQ
jgi:surface antigen